MLRVTPVHAESARYAASLLFLPELWTPAEAWLPVASFLGHRGWESQLIHLRDAGDLRARVESVMAEARRLPHPPILMGGGGPRLLALAAREADIVSIVLRSRTDGSGLDRADFAAASMARKVRQVQAAAGDRWATLELSTLIQRVVVTDDRDTPATQLGERYGLPPEQVLESPYILLGTVAQLCEVLLARREQYGLSYIVVFEPGMDAFAPVVARLANH